MEDDKLVALSAKVSRECSEQLRYLADKAQISQSKLVSNILDTVVPDLMVCDKIGVWQLSYILRDMGDSLKAWVKLMKDEAEEVNGVGSAVTQ